MIGKAHRLGLQSRPSPWCPRMPRQSPTAKAAGRRRRTATPRAQARAGASRAARPQAGRPVTPPPAPAPAPVLIADRPRPKTRITMATTPICRPRQPLAPSAGPALGRPRRLPPAGAAASSRRRSHARPAPAPGPGQAFGRTSPARPRLLDLSDKVCKWPLGHPGEPDFHFCGDKVNPGFPYCVAHCGHAYQAQLPRRDRRAPPIPFGGPRLALILRGIAPFRCDPVALGA
ncbi:MAG: GcrA family cell cycle regulator [Candidatus Sphingomonas colombiensis]|nr:GcrA family cell cycle regulator [Sphingomonas sp.]WEK41763.1 MAG: GcrA family cell cycle regulator [Sphingomonas sp.]